MSTRLFFSCMVLLACFLDVSPAVAAKKKKAKLPKFRKVEQLVAAHFAAIKNHQPGDLITRDQVKAVLARIEKKLKWKVADGPAMLKQTIGPEEFLPRQLRTEQGRRFMRQTARFPGGYDRLDRLSKLPDGRRILTKLIHGPDGHKLIEYFATSRGGKELGRMLSRAPGGEDFNKPTQRIYTLQQFMDRLRRSYEAAKSRPPRAGRATSR